MTIIDHTPADNQAATPTGVRHPVVGHDDVMYRMLPFHISIAAVHAQQFEGVAPEEFPASTGDWITDGIAMRTFLEERGLWEVYRKHLAESAFVADCPGWCGVRHASISGDNFDIVHELPVATVTLHDDTEVTFTIQGFQDQLTVGQPHPFLFVNNAPKEMQDSELTAGDAAELGAAFIKAGEILADIERLLGGGVEQAPDEAQR